MHFTSQLSAPCTASAGPETQILLSKATTPVDHGTSCWRGRLVIDARETWTGPQSTSNAVGIAPVLRTGRWPFFISNKFPCHVIPPFWILTVMVIVIIVRGCAQQGGSNAKPVLFGDWRHRRLLQSDFHDPPPSVSPSTMGNGSNVLIGFCQPAVSKSVVFPSTACLALYHRAVE